MKRLLALLLMLGLLLSGCTKDARPARGTDEEIKALRRESSTLSSGAAMYFVPELEDKDDPAALREALRLDGAVVLEVSGRVRCQTGSCTEPGAPGEARLEGAFVSAKVEKVLAGQTGVRKGDSAELFLGNLADGFILPQAEVFSEGRRLLCLVKRFDGAPYGLDKALEVNLAATAFLSETDLCLPVLEWHGWLQSWTGAYLDALEPEIKALFAAPLPEAPSSGEEVTEEQLALLRQMYPIMEHIDGMPCDRILVEHWSELNHLSQAAAVVELLDGPELKGSWTGGENEPRPLRPSEPGYNQAPFVRAEVTELLGGKGPEAGEQISLLLGTASYTALVRYLRPGGRFVVFLSDAANARYPDMPRRYSAQFFTMCYLSRDDIVLDAHGDPLIQKFSGCTLETLRTLIRENYRPEEEK